MGYGRINAADALDLVQAQRFVIRNGQGRHIASLDEAGNFIMEGDLTENASVAQLNPTWKEEFIVRDGTDEVLRLTEDGDLWVDGDLYENVDVNLDSPSQVTSVALRIKDPQGVTVALVNAESFYNFLIEPQSPHTVPAGSVILKGRAFVGADPDRASSQGN